MNVVHVTLVFKTMDVSPFLGFPRSCSLDVIPSKEIEHGSTSNFEDLGRNSLGDLFSPVRDGELIDLKLLHR